MRVKAEPAKAGDTVEITKNTHGWDAMRVYSQVVPKGTVCKVTEVRRLSGAGWFGLQAWIEYQEPITRHLHGVYVRLDRCKRIPTPDITTPPEGPT